jgi:hypothetical protein
VTKPDAVFASQELAALDGLVRRLELVADKKQPQ